MQEAKPTRRAVLAAAPGFVLAAGQGVETVAIASGGKPLFEYRYGKELPKPYVHPLFAPDGSALTLESPPDHKHHRGLMIGWTIVNGFDFWGEPGSTPGPHGFIVH
jgi:hypothetical protein